MANAAERAYDHIRQGILSGHFEPGQWLKEAELVRYCGVSRTPVRAALNRLTSEDYLEAEQNHGARVKVWGEVELDELFDLRALLEGYAAARAAERITAKQLAQINKAIDDMDRILGSKSALTRKISSFLKLNHVVHSTIWSASESERLVHMLGRLVEQSLQVRTVRTFSLQRLGESHNHHQELLRALSAGDGIWAEAIMRSHIRAARDALGQESPTD